MSKTIARFRVAVVAVANLVWLFMTSSRFVGWVDSGELAAACCSLGIPHPTGYPIYTLLCRVAHIIHPSSAIEAATALSWIPTAGAGILLILILRRIARETGLTGNSGLALVVLSPALMLLSYTSIGWNLAVNHDVYALNLFFVSAFVLSVMTADRKRSLSCLIATAYILGLSLAHHRLAVLTALGFLAYLLIDLPILLDYARNRLAHFVRTLSYCLGATLLGLTSYLYLPIRAAQEPLFNWGNPVTFDSFLRHVMGWQYSSWVFSKSISEWTESFADLLIMTLNQIPIALVVFAIVGVIFLLLLYRKLGLSLLAAFLGNLIVVSGYTIPEIDTYLLPVIFIYLIWFAVGLHFAIRFAVSKLFKAGIETKAGLVTGIALFALSVLLIAENMPLADRSDYRYADTQTELVFSQLEPEAVILTANWDIYSPLIYKQHAEEKRQDITAIDIELLRRTWYYKYVEQRDPGLFAKIEINVSRLLPLISLFENDKPYNASEIEDAYQSTILALASISDRPVYCDMTVAFRDQNMFIRIPQGLLYRLLPRGAALDPREPGRFSLGDVDRRLLEFDYSLKKQVEIARRMNLESMEFWDWWKDSQADTTSSR